MKPRTTVYVAMNGLVKVADGIKYRQERVTLASDPAVAKYPDAWRELGTVDAETAAVIEMLDDEAVLPRLWERIAPVGGEHTSDVPEPTPDEQDGGLSWPRIEDTYRRLASTPPGRLHRRRRPDEPSRPEVAKELLVSTATLKRACVAALYPFGSAFWHNLARCTWRVTKSGDTGGHVVTLAHRKHNNYASLGKFTLAVEWRDNIPRDVWEQGYSAALSDRIDAAFGSDALTVRELVARIDEDRDEDDPATRPNSVRTALRRGLKAALKRYTITGTGDGAKWSRTP